MFSTLLFWSPLWVDLLYQILFHKSIIEIGESKKTFWSHRQTLTHVNLKLLKCIYFSSSSYDLWEWRQKIKCYFRTCFYTERDCVKTIRHNLVSTWPNIKLFVILSEMLSSTDPCWNLNAIVVIFYINFYKHSSIIELVNYLINPWKRMSIFYHHRIESGVINAQL